MKYFLSLRKGDYKEETYLSVELAASSVRSVGSIRSSSIGVASVGVLTAGNGQES